MSYSEPTAGLTLDNELPMATETGILRAEHFDFTVATSATGKVKIPYEISVTPNFTASNLVVTGCTEGVVPTEQTACTNAGGTWSETSCSAPTMPTEGSVAATNAVNWCNAIGGKLTTTGNNNLPDSNIRVYLTKGANAVQADNTTSTTPLVSELTTETSTGLRPGSKLLYSTFDDYTTTPGSTSTNYSLRMWIDNATDVTKWLSQVTYKYSLLVNVDSHVAPLS